MKFVIMFFILATMASCASDPFKDCGSVSKTFDENGKVVTVCSRVLYPAPPLHKQ